MLAFQSVRLDVCAVESWKLKRPRFRKMASCQYSKKSRPVFPAPGAGFFLFHRIDSPPVQIRAQTKSERQPTTNKNMETTPQNPTRSGTGSSGTACYASWVRSMTIRGFVKAMNQKMPMAYPRVRYLCDENGIPMAAMSLTKPVRLATRISVRYNNDGTDRIVKIFPA